MGSNDDLGKEDRIYHPGFEAKKSGELVWNGEGLCLWSPALAWLDFLSLLTHLGSSALCRTGRSYWRNCLRRLWSSAPGSLLPGEGSCSELQVHHSHCIILVVFRKMNRGLCLALWGGSAHMSLLCSGSRHLFCVLTFSLSSFLEFSHFLHGQGQAECASTNSQQGGGYLTAQVLAARHAGEGVARTWPEQRACQHKRGEMGDGPL